MKDLMMIFSLVAVFLTSSLFAQETLAEENKKQNRYNNQTKQANKIQTKGQHGTGFVDENGDGYNDNAPDQDGDGIPNGQDDDFVRPEDGSGRMNKSGNGNGSGLGMGSGDCDGTGPKGSSKQSGRK